MPVIENLKNFIRHGKQAKHLQHHHDGTPQTGRNQRQVHSDPISGATDLHQKPVPAVDYPLAPAGDNRNAVPQASGVAANVAGNHHLYDPGVVAEGAGSRGVHAGGIPGAAPGTKYDDNLISKIVAEEKEKKEKLPKYPGLERYTLVEKMGDGAFSNVYRARDSYGEFGEVAIKVVRKYELNSSQQNHLHPDFKKAPKTVERANILKEVQIMSSLNHPNIVSLLQFSESRSYYYLVLELLSGGELFHQIVRLTYFSENLSRHVIAQVAEALRYLHEERGVVHRDIKPENLLFEPIPFIPTKDPKPKAPDEEDKADEGEFILGLGAGGIGKIKVADFGLSKVVWDSQTMTPCGTVGYTAPEIVKDERYSKSVDMWALGCVLYTLLCGFPPFYDESISVLTEKVAKGQYTFLSPWWDEISKSAKDLVSHLLTVDPDKRYTVQQFLNHPWIKQTDEPTSAAEDAPPIESPTAVKVKSPSPMVVDVDFPSPGHAGKRLDFRSPGAVSLREVFDVGYAVHRMEEEGKRRKKWKQGYRGAPLLNAMDEEDEYDSDEDDDQLESRSKVLRQSGDAADDVAESLKKTTITSHGQNQNHQPARHHGMPAKQGQAATKNQGKKKNVAFELSLDNATLLGRRKKHRANQEHNWEQVVQVG